MSIKLMTVAILAIAAIHFPATAVAEPADEHGSAVEPAITPGMQRGHGSDFLRPQFEHERNREFTERDFRERSMRDYDDFGDGMERRSTTPQSTPPGLERRWESLEDDYEWRY